MASSMWPGPPKGLLEGLTTSSSDLKCIGEDFANVAQAYRYNIITFYESLKTSRITTVRHLKWIQ
jgi:hypothetical protein